MPARGVGAVRPGGYPALRKAKDAGILVGLGGAVLVTLVASTVASTAVGWISDAIGLEKGGWGGSCCGSRPSPSPWAPTSCSCCRSSCRCCPASNPPAAVWSWPRLIGAVGFELLKLLLSGYMQGVAAKSMYGAFGVPVALLLWINFTMKLVVFCAAWTATQS
ncbi:YihY/virulence factor BrkB family protein [Streptomyces hirsutus]